MTNLYKLYYRLWNKIPFCIDIAILLCYYERNKTYGFYYINLVLIGDVNNVGSIL